jgi:hypothetical protein
LVLSILTKRPIGWRDLGRVWALHEWVALTESGRYDGLFTFLSNPVIFVTLSVPLLFS